MAMSWPEPPMAAAQAWLRSHGAPPGPRMLLRWGWGRAPRERGGVELMPAGWMGGAVPLSREHLEDKEAGAFRAGKRASESGCERSLARVVSVSFLPGEGGSGGGFSDQKGVGGPEASPEGPRLSPKHLLWASSVVEEDAWSSLCPAPSKHAVCGLGWP